MLTNAEQTVGGLVTLEANKVRRGMIEMFKMMTGQGKADIIREFFQLAPTREGALNTREHTGYLNVAEPPQCMNSVRRN